MEANIIDQIPFELKAEALADSFRVDKNNSYFKTIVKFCDEAQKIARPKFIYNVSFIEERGDDFVVIEGVRFKSRVMSVNLSEVNRVFPIIATCGRELDEWSKNFTDLLENYLADQIKEKALRVATNTGLSELKKKYQLGRTSYMSPGSLEDWPLTEQASLFALLGKGPSTIGVDLTDSFLMLPTKSVSRLLFATETDYQNCSLCPRETCPNRRAPHSPELFKEKYGLKGKS